MNEVMGKLFIFQKSMKDMRKREVGDGIKNSNLTFFVQKKMDLLDLRVVASNHRNLKHKRLHLYLWSLTYF